MLELPEILLLASLRVQNMKSLWPSSRRDGDDNAYADS